MADNATFTFSVPEDTGSNYMQLYSCSTKDGSYAQVGNDIAYEYGKTTYEYESINAVLWYKIRFYNSADEQYSPYSEPVYGGDWSTNTKPFLAISTTTDGANYASIQDVRDFSGLNSDDVTDNRVSQALRRSRAIVDIKTSEMGIDRFVNFSSAVKRRKYNATLRIVKEAEINYTLGMIYRGMVDDLIIQESRNQNKELSSLRMGQASLDLNQSSAGQGAYRQLERLSLLYTNRATVLLSMIQPSSISISYRDIYNTGGLPKFLWPPNRRA
jgi:hypothetical protein